MGQTKSKSKTKTTSKSNTLSGADIKIDDFQSDAEQMARKEPFSIIDESEWTKIDDQHQNNYWKYLIAVDATNSSMIIVITEAKSGQVRPTATLSWTFQRPVSSFISCSDESCSESEKRCKHWLAQHLPKLAETHASAPAVVKTINLWLPRFKCWKPDCAYCKTKSIDSVTV